MKATALTSIILLISITMGSAPLNCIANGSQPKDPKNKGVTDMKVDVSLKSTSRPTLHHGKVLNRSELHTLSAISQKMEFMINPAEFNHTRVWPHGVRDERGRIGLFISCAYPFTEMTTGPELEGFKAWVIYTVIAAVKYSEGSPVRIDHLGFAEFGDSSGDKWYWDLDMATAKLVHKKLFSKGITADEAYSIITKSWARVTEK
jgi:hypothetical protein